MSSKLRVERLEGLAALENFRPEWDALCQASEPRPPCNEAAWVLAHLRAFDRAQGCFALVVRDQHGRAVSCLPLYREPARSLLALRRLRHAADGNFDAEMLEPLWLPGTPDAVLAVLLEALAAEAGAQALLLSCAPLDSLAVTSTLALCAKRGWPVRREPLVYLCAELGETFEATLLGLRPRMRSKVRAALRSIGEHNASTRFVERPHDLEPALELLFELHQARWTAVGQPGSFADSRRRDFYRSFAAHYLRAGRLRLALLERGGQALAVQLGITTGSTYTQIQEGYAPQESAWRPGTALRAWVLEQCCGQGVRRCDFQEGDAPHKRDWGARELPAATLVIALSWRAKLEFELRRRLGR